ncbi:MAG TPA: hypothetical protein VGC45_01965 [Gryllotalpicola sp.]
MQTTRVAAQVGGTSIIDEGAPAVLDALQGRAAADTVFLAATTWSRETGGRAPSGYADHGVASTGAGWTGGNYAKVRPEFYRRTALGPVPRAGDAGDRDALAETVDAAHERGMEVFALVDESASAPELRRYPGFLACLEVDMWNKPARRPCYNNPDYRNWHLGLIEDYVANYELDGLSWRAERFGPLTLLAQGPALQGLGLISCFCDWCKAKAADRGIDWRPAQTGYRALVALNAAASNGERPADGVFASFWRLLLRYPEILAWQALWTDGQVQLYRDIFGSVRAIRPDMEVGWDLDPIATLSPFHRANLDFSELSHICDFLKVGTYTASGGAALARTAHGLARALLGDADVDAVYPVLQTMLGIRERPLDELDESGLSAAYVGAEVARAVETNEGRCVIYAGIDVDIPVGEDDSPDGTRNTDYGGRGVSRSSDEQIASAIGASIDAGAAGIVLGRKYAEMRGAHLDAVGRAVRDLTTN